MSSRLLSVSTEQQPPRSTTPAVEVSDLTKQFYKRDGRRGWLRRRRRTTALEGITLTIARGECVAILGQNGSGKSTLVRLLSTLLLPDGGSARVFGLDVFTESRPVRRLINRVSVEASFFKKMSSMENLSYAARFYGMTASETRARIPEILQQIGFPPERRNEPMEGLSRGMQQKVALCARPSHVSRSPPLGRAHHRARPAVEARGAGFHSPDAGLERRDHLAVYA